MQDDNNREQNNQDQNSDNPNNWNYSPGNDNQNNSNQQQNYTNGNYYNTPNNRNNNDNYKWNFDDYQAAEQPIKSKRSKGLGVFGALVASVFVVGIVFLAGFGIYTLFGNGFISDDYNIISPNSSSNSSPQISINNPPQNFQSPILSDGPLSTKEIVKLSKPSVVGIENYGSANTFSPTNEGSGIVMNKEGYIITNAHVVDGAMGINVVLNNNETYSAKLIGIDRKTDLAVVKIEADNLVAASFGNSDLLEDGDKVVAIGNPGGMQLAATTTQGIVSTAKRSFKSDGGYSTTYVQTDAAINPGNSGGPLINEYGQVIGINTAKIVAEGYEGIGFAIPINEAKPIIDELIQYGHVTGRTKIGISGNEINEIMSQAKNLPMGIYIFSIEPMSDLAGKNVKKGDIIVKIDGTNIDSFDDVSTILKTKKPEDSITMTLYRPGVGNTPGTTFEIVAKLMADVDK